MIIETRVEKRFHGLTTIHQYDPGIEKPFGLGQQFTGFIQKAKAFFFSGDELIDAPNRCQYLIDVLFAGQMLRAFGKIHTQAGYIDNMSVFISGQHIGPGNIP